MEQKSIASRTQNGHHSAWLLSIRISLALVILLSMRNNAAQTNAPSEPVVIPGIETAGMGKPEETKRHFAVPSRANGQSPAVLILHGSGGVDAKLSTSLTVKPQAMQAAARTSLIRMRFHVLV